MERRLANLRRWPRGTSGNPSGRRKPPVTPAECAEEKAKSQEREMIRDIREAAKVHSALALRTLTSALADADCPWQAKIVAAKEILDRAWGKSKEHVQQDVKLDLVWLLNRGQELQREREQQERERQDQGGFDGERCN
jgi:Family of unknown function (DUF5681)